MEMSRTPRPLPNARALLLVFGAWTAVAILFALQVRFQSHATGGPPPEPWGRILVWQLSGWWSWAALTPPVCAFAAWVLRLRRPVYIVGIHLVAALAAAVLCAALEGAVKWSFHLHRVPHTLPGAVAEAVGQYWPFNVLVYAMVVGLFYSIRAMRLETQLIQARLDVLTAQLQPHFLFNTLHAISALVLEDPRTANRMITRLSELLRHTFSRARGQQVTLEEELELLDHYVAIQEARFGDRLRVTFQVDPATATATVPTLLLQPLVENAIRYGGGGGGGSGGGRWGEGVTEVQVAISRHDGRLRLEVRDNGPGFPPGVERSGGVGLANTRARLEQLYGAAYRFELVNGAPPRGGAVATIDIPFIDDAHPHR
ncbi:MAG: sensor histidine kinase [Gemmatimonadales bacterium]